MRGARGLWGTPVEDKGKEVGIEAGSESLTLG